MYEYKADLIKVIDGDTVDLMVDLGFGVCKTVRVRLAYVDTPEIYGVKKESFEYKLGTAASNRTQSWFDDNGKSVLLKTFKDSTGKYGRYIGVISTLDKDKSLNEHLVDFGYGSKV